MQDGYPLLFSNRYQLERGADFALMPQSEKFRHYSDLSADEKARSKACAFHYTLLIQMPVRFSLAIKQRTFWYGGMDLNHRFPD